MRRAFTLVELLVSFTVLAVISGGALIYLNNFIAKEELNTVSSEVVTSLKLAQSYAKTRQLPLLASGKNDLKFVQVQVIGGKLVAGANGVGDTYFTIVPKNEKIILATNPVIIYFWAGDGKLVKDATGTPYTSSENAYIIIQSDNNLVGYDQVEISNLGQIISSFANGTANLLKITPLPTMAILPTILVTKVPTALPTVSSCLPENFYRCFSDTDCCSGLHCGYNGNCNSYCLVNGSACTSNGEICCSENCQNGICQPHPILTPIPTKLPCKAFGATCSVYDIGLLYQGGTACCNRGCSNSKCCRGNGQNCDTDADCCLFDSKTNSYKNFGCVNKVCQVRDLSKLTIGSACTQSDQCANNICDNNRCISCKPVLSNCTASSECCPFPETTSSSPCLYGKCQMPSPTPTAVPTQSCIAPGASCYYDNDRCCKTNNIFYKCSGPWGDKKCIASVPTPTPGNPCLKLNNECTSSLECCNGRCEFYKWSTTQKRCCAAVGGDYCGSSPAGYGTPIDFGDCCDGSFCYGNRCYPNGFDTDTLWSLNNGKKIIGEPCTSDTDCLNNRCDNQRCQDFVSGVGSSNLNCVPSGSIMAAPVYPSRCCSGNANGNLCF